MRNRLIRVLLFTLALSLLAVSYCAFACADGEVLVTAPGYGSFDVIGSAGGGNISATEGGRGFRTWLQVIEDGMPFRLAEETKLDFGTEYGTEDILVSLGTETGFDGRAAVITYEIRNVSDAAHTVRVGSCGNTSVGGYDASVIKRGGGFVAEAGGLSVLVFPGDYLFDGTWCGAPGTNSSNLSYLDQDCDVSWYWYLTLQPGQTAYRSVVIAVGDVQFCSVFLDPNGGQTYKYEPAARQERLALKNCAYRLPAAPFVKSDCLLQGWAVNKDAEEPNYLDRGIISAGEVTDGMILYAVWKDKRLQEIEAGDLSVPFGDPAEISAKSTDGRLSYSVSAGSDVISVDERGRITTLKTGIAKVAITAAATNDYKETTKSITVTVVPKQLDRTMLKITPETIPFTGDAERPTISVANGERPMLRGTDYEIDASSVLAATALGEYRVTIEGLGNYAGSVSAVWKIAKSAPEVRVSPFAGTYDGTAHPLLTVDAHTGGTLQFSPDQNGPYSEAVPEATDAGTYTVWYRVVGNEFFLDASPASCAAEIARKAVTVSGISADNKVYDASSIAQLRLDRAVIAGLCPGDRVELRSADGRFADAEVGQNKRVSISAITLGGPDAGNYVLGPQQQTEVTASITPKQLTIRAKDQQIALYGNIAQGTDQVTVDGLCSYDALRSVTLSRPQSLNETGTGSITPSRAVIVRSGSTQETTKNYTITYVPGTLRAEQRELTLTWTETEFVYDGKSHAPKATVSGTRYGEALKVTVTGSKIAATPEGEVYVATASGLIGTNALFYKLPEEATQTFVITPRTLEQDEITVEYRPNDEDAVIGPVPNDGKAYGFKSIVVRDGTRRLRKDVDYTVDSEYSDIYGPHTLHITGKGNYEGSLARDWTMIGNGLISTGVEVKNGAAAVEWTNASEELTDSLLDDEDLWLRERYGTPIDVYLQIRPAVTPSGISAKAGQIGEKIAANYDIALYKRIGNYPKQIRDTGGRVISVTLDIPDEMYKAPLGYYRSFSLIHLHDGTAEVLAQGTGRSFSFSTTSFSSFAISYQDIKLSPSSSPPTGDTARIPLWGTMLLLSVCGLLCLIPKTRKE